MTVSYENLQGEEGKKIFVRPKRYSCDEIFSGNPPVLIFENERFFLTDISISGIGAYARADEVRGAPHVQSQVGLLKLEQFGQELLCVEARQTRALEKNGRLNIGFSLEANPLDLVDLRTRNARAMKVSEANSSSAFMVPDGYKVICADVLAFLGDYRKHIQTHFSPIENELSKALVDEIVEDLSLRARDRWNELLRRGHEAVRPFHADVVARGAFKAYTEKTLLPVFLDGAGWARSYNKPLGYPGDFKIMNYVYEHDLEGDGIYNKFVHKLSLDGAQAVKSRLDLFVDIAACHINDKHEVGASAKILSIGAGPARELESLILKLDKGVNLRAVLVDQEEQALEFALANMKALNIANLAVEAINISFREMLMPNNLAENFANCDIIYSLGMVDYLSPLLARRFVGRLYQLLPEGGKLIIGNVSDRVNGGMWPCEYIVDWSMFFRTHEDMIAMASDLSEAKIDIMMDRLEAIHFLMIEKPKKGQSS